jgi:hypothetical protein
MKEVLYIIYDPIMDLTPEQCMKVYKAINGERKRRRRKNDDRHNNCCNSDNRL